MAHTVLVVDDDASTLQLLEQALVRQRYTVLTAASAEEGLALLEAHPVDVVVADEKMPGMSGSEMLARVRRSRPETVRLVLTGHATLETAIRAINEGEIYRFFTKPCNMVDLTISIRQALERRELLRENRRLSAVVERQAASLEALESRCPGITRVRRDPGGAVILDDEE